MQRVWRGALVRRRVKETRRRRDHAAALIQVKGDDPPPSRDGSLSFEKPSFSPGAVILHGGREQRGCSQAFAFCLGGGGCLRCHLATVAPFCLSNGMCSTRVLPRFVPLPSSPYLEPSDATRHLGALITPRVISDDTIDSFCAVLRSISRKRTIASVARTRTTMRACPGYRRSLVSVVRFRRRRQSKRPTRTAHERNAHTPRHMPRRTNDRPAALLALCLPPPACPPPKTHC